MVLEAFIEALKGFASFDLLLFMMAGIIAGLIFGIIPGIGNLVLMSLFLSFVFTLRVEQALPFMVSAMAVGFMGGSISAILLNIPGTAPNAATLIDGFPMSQKGEGGRALGAALTASGMGSIFSAFAALAVIPLILPMVYALRSAEMVFIILMGIAFIAVLGTGSMRKGLMSGILGLFVSLIGFQVVTGVARFTFGSAYLYDGLPLVPIALGLFAVPEMIALARKGGTIAQTGVVIKGLGDVFRGVKDVFHHWWLCLRCSIIGFIIGIIPGVGAVVSTFIAYGYAKQTSKYPERFGTGIVEGVIAPESANDSKEAGALLTTFALGIPGSSVMAILLGAFLMLGITPGPEMLTTRLSLSVNLMLLIIVASVIGALICLPLAPRMARIASIPGRILVPLVLVVVFVGGFANHQRFDDLIIVLLFTVVGLTMQRFGYNRPAFFLGYILGELFEYYFFIALQADGPLFFTRPISLGIIAVIVALFTYKPIVSLFRHWFKRGVKQA